MTELVSYRGFVVTPDCADALRLLERSGLRLSLSGTPSRGTSWEGVQQHAGLSQCPPEISMRGTGREVCIRAHNASTADVWGQAIPLGFTPFSRYPLEGVQSTLFHFFGVWQEVIDRLNAHPVGWVDAWSSVCCAAQLDVGTWEGTNTNERLIQAHLHRLGSKSFYGAIDGMLGESAQLGLREFGISDRVQEMSEIIQTF